MNKSDRVSFLDSFGVGHFQIALGMASPDAKEQVHGNDRHLIEEVEEKQIEGHEDADGRRRQNQQGDVKFLGSILYMPGHENSGEQENARGEDQGCTDAVAPEIE